MRGHGDYGCGNYRERQSKKLAIANTGIVPFWPGAAKSDAEIGDSLTTAY